MPIVSVSRVRPTCVILMQVATGRAKLNALILPTDTRFTGSRDDFDCLHGEAFVARMSKSSLVRPGLADTSHCGHTPLLSGRRTVLSRAAHFVLLALLVFS